jgi:hypothetical protein
MTHIETAAENYRQSFKGPGNHISSMDIKESFEEGAEYMLERMLKYLEAEHPTFFDHFGEEIRKVME